MSVSPVITIPLSHETGAVKRYADFASHYVLPRHIDIWRPPDYETALETRYPVIYMHDGQNLFEPDSSYIGVDWGVDEAMVRLIHEHQFPGAIVVGIWNNHLRLREYMPYKPLVASSDRNVLAQFNRGAGGLPLSDYYLKFIIAGLKPFVDKTHRTLTDRANTFIMGSSMGGLISLYALAEYPDVFGGAACLSTHWPIGQEVVVDYFGAALPKAGQHRLYFDYGTATLDADYEPYQQRLDVLLQAAGYTTGRDWITRKFDGADHSERAWRARAHLPLAFLLQPEQRGRGAN